MKQKLYTTVGVVCILLIGLVAGWAISSLSYHSGMIADEFLLPWDELSPGGKQRAIDLASGEAKALLQEWADAGKVTISVPPHSHE